MSLEKLLNSILDGLSVKFPFKTPSKLLDNLSKLNPDKIYVENIRSILDTSTKEAERICETAVRQGVFTRRVEVLNPGGGVAASAESVDKLPPTITYWEDQDGNYEQITTETKDLRKIVYYKLATSRRKTGQSQHVTV